MAKYQLVEPTVDILKATAENYTLEDGSIVPNPAYTGGINYIEQSKTFITDADVAAQYVAVPLV